MKDHKPDNTRPACKQFQDLLESWRTQTVSDENSQFMQTHHDSCPACQQELQLAVQIDAVTSELSQLKCPPLPALAELGTANPDSHHQPGFLSRLIEAWRQPLVLVPACSALLTAVLVLTIINADQADEPQLLVINGEEYTQEEVRQAVEELELALQYIDKYSRYPGQIMTTELTESQIPFIKRDDSDTPPI